MCVLYGAGSNRGYDEGDVHDAGREARHPCQRCCAGPHLVSFPTLSHGLVGMSLLPAASARTADSASHQSMWVLPHRAQCCTVSSSDANTLVALLQDAYAAVVLPGKGHQRVWEAGAA